MKRSVCSVAELGIAEGQVHAPRAYELPDGQQVLVGAPQQLVPELLFRPDLLDTWRLSLVSRTTANWTTHYNSGVVTRAAQSNLPLSLQQMVYSALLACQPEFRRELCGHGAWRAARGRGGVARRRDHVRRKLPPWRGWICLLPLDPSLRALCRRPCRLR